MTMVALTVDSIKSNFLDYSGECMEVVELFEFVFPAKRERERERNWSGGMIKSSFEENK